MTPRWTLAAALALVACQAEPAPPAPLPPGPASSPTRWVAPAPPDDQALLVLPARVVGDPAAHGVVAPLLTGRVVVLAARAGDTVAAGAPVAELAAPEAVAAAAGLLGAQRQLRPVRDRLRELRRLRKKGLAAAEPVYALTARVAELEAAVEAGRAKLRALGLDPGRAQRLTRTGRVVLHSPIAGVVRAVHARIGEVRSHEDGPLVEVVGVGPARVEARLPRALPAGARPVFVPLEGRPVPLQPAPVGEAPALDEAGTLAWFAPVGAAPLPHGLRGELRLAPSSDDVFQVPRAAVVVDGGEAQVARRAGEAEVEWVRVEILSGAGATALVKGPLRVSDRVAADGRKLRAAAPEAGR